MVAIAQSLIQIINMAMLKTSDLIGPSDIAVHTWINFTLDKATHVFGFCEATRHWQLSSAVVSKGEGYFQTRSRKYFVEGETCTSLPLDGVLELKDMLFVYWQIPLDKVKQIIEHYSIIQMNDVGEIILNSKGHEYEVISSCENFS
jgi:hypothetical protein